MPLLDAKSLQKHVHSKNPNAIIIGVSKFHTSKDIRYLYSKGIRNFGENRLQEAMEKISQLQNLFPYPAWHFIGRLQENKIRKIVELFDFIHSVDSLDIAKKINERAFQNGKIQKVLLQVNIANESSKAGFSKEQIPIVFPQISQLKNLELVGLMAHVPQTADPEKSRVHFKNLRSLRNSIGRHPRQLQHLSMGTSQDFEIALEEGATMLRLGTVLFGKKMEVV
ncbi:YggS family pyridoxal phosphate-dependent enzyme [Candidatus Micrarchaeota archaeon]|nr:YggS family pyridoxal phosphate-dependent enzyme [Candidatus Micrarchaeota archaeon]